MYVHVLHAHSLLCVFVWTLSNRALKVTFNYANEDMKMEVIGEQDNVYVSPA